MPFMSSTVIGFSVGNEIQADRDAMRTNNGDAISDNSRSKLNANIRYLSDCLRLFNRLYPKHICNRPS
jgi:hypothetical protein